VISLSKLVWVVVVLAVASASGGFFIRWIRKLFPVDPRPQLAPRPVSGFEYIITIVPLIVFLLGVYSFPAVVLWMGHGDLKLPNALSYAGVVVFTMIAVHLLLPRLWGKKFYHQYFRLGEMRSGISQRGALIFISAIGVGFLVAAALAYVFDHLS